MKAPGLTRSMYFTRLRQELRYISVTNAYRATWGLKALIPFGRLEGDLP